MKIEEAKQTIESLLKQCEEARNIAKTAERNRKSLSGSGSYADRFHLALIEISKLEFSIKNLVSATGLEDAATNNLFPQLETIKSKIRKSLAKTAALKQIHMFCHVDLLPRLEGMTASSIPATEQVLPVSVVQGTRTYIEKIVVQANGCYEHQWYDACSVMIRRLAETLIIELYEATGKASDIKGNDGNFLMLSFLVDRILADTTWNLSRETRANLPLLKSLGDRSAHNRRYTAQKKDIDNALPGFRVTADDLLHLAKLK